MTTALFEALAAGLTLWKDKNATKYLDDVLKLQKEWVDEYNKPREKRSNANLDHIEQQLHIISKLFTSSVRGKDV
jgi:hypothetical protein